MARTVVTIGATGFTDLILGEGTDYHLPPSWLNVGTSGFRKQTPDSPWTTGRSLTSFALDVVTFSAKFEIGNVTSPLSSVTVLNDLDALLQRVRTADWTFQVAYDTTAVMKWTCEPAAVTPDFNRLLLAAGWLPVTVTAERDPIPVTGPF